MRSKIGKSGIELPEWQVAYSAVGGGTATPLDVFIYHNEPAGEEDSKEFRDLLTNMVEYLIHAIPSGGEPATIKRDFIERITIEGPTSEDIEAFSYCAKNGFRIVRSGFLQIDASQYDPSHYVIVAERPSAACSTSSCASC